MERLECSFAKQEAKLDRHEAKLDILLNMMTAQTPVPQTPQCTDTSVYATNFSTAALLRNALQRKFFCIVSGISTAPSCAEAAGDAR